MRRNTSKHNPNECFDHYYTSIEDKNDYGLALNKNFKVFNVTDKSA